MLALFAERGGDPARRARRTHWTRCCGGPLDRTSRVGTPAARPPGWHVECTAIALDRLGPAVDVMGGGRTWCSAPRDGCLARTRAQRHSPFVRVFMHAGLVGYQGEKMSSRGQPGVRVRAAPGRRGPGRDPPGIAGAPLRLGLGVHRADLAAARPDWLPGGPRCRDPTGPRAAHPGRGPRAWPRPGRPGGAGRDRRMGLAGGLGRTDPGATGVVSRTVDACSASRCSKSHSAGRQFRFVALAGGLIRGSDRMSGHHPNGQSFGRAEVRL